MHPHVPALPEVLFTISSDAYSCFINRRLVDNLDEIIVLDDGRRCPIVDVLTLWCRESCRTLPEIRRAAAVVDAYIAAMREVTP